MATYTLEDLGYREYFEQSRVSAEAEGYSIARVTAEHKGAYRIKDLEGECLARVTGKQMFDAVSREDYPAVGDWVAITRLQGDQAVIHGLLPRKTLLKRKYSSRNESQVIAANIDTAFIVESVDRDFNLNRFERYQAIANEGNVWPAMVLNKIDICTDAELKSKISRVRKRLKGVDLLSTSTLLDDGLTELKAYISKGETYCFLGSSGVGKSSIINRLLGEDFIETKSISSRTGKGIHTTTSREMYFLQSGGILIDNPGMREIGIADADTGIENVFIEIETLASECRFKDCTHTQEPGCAVREAVESGKLDEGRFENYLKLTREAEFYEMTTLEKRRKDRQFGRFIKNTKKELNLHRE